MTSANTFPAPPISERQSNQALDRVRRALSGLLAQQPFFGIAAMHLTPPTPRSDIFSLASDGLRLYYKPEWVLEANSNEIVHAVAHCVTACALKHHTRRGDRTSHRWQTASRQVTQHILLRHGLADPAHGQGSDLSVVQAYNALPPDPPPHPTPAPMPQMHQHQDQDADAGAGPQQQPGSPATHPPDGGPQQQDQPGQPSQDSQTSTSDNAQNPPGQPGPKTQDPGSGSSGSARDSQATPPADQTGAGQTQDDTAPQPPQDPMAGRGKIIDYPGEAPDGGHHPDLSTEETRWDDISHQAMTMAQGQGNAPGNLKELIARSHAPTIDWRSALREYINDFTDQHRSWAVPDRRFISSGLYLPGPHSDSVESICFAIDTSASLNRNDLARAWAEIRDAVETLEPGTVRIIQCDAAIQEDLTHDGFDLPEKLEAKGRRGTRYHPVFRLLEEDPPMFLIYLTDLDCSDRPPAPAFPVLWLCTDPATTRQPPFGERLDMAPGR